MRADAAKKLANSGYNIVILSSSGKEERLANDLGGIGFTGSNQSNNDLSTIVDLTYRRPRRTFHTSDGEYIGVPGVLHMPRKPHNSVVVVGLSQVSMAATLSGSIAKKPLSHIPPTYLTYLQKKKHLERLQ